MDETRDTSLPSGQVAIPVRLILISAVAVVLANVVRHAGSWDYLVRALPLGLLEAAVWSILAWRIARGQNWARVAFATLAILDLFSIVTLREVSATWVLGAVGTSLRVVAVFLLFRSANEAIFRPPGRVERSWVFPLTLIAVLTTQVALALVVCYMVAKDAASGEWHRAIGSIWLDSTSLFIAIAFCFSRHSWRRVIAKIAVVLLAVATPIAAQALLLISEPLVSYHLERDRHRDFKSFMEAWRAENEYYAKLRDWREGRAPFPQEPKPQGPVTSSNPAREVYRTHTAELKALFESKQHVVAAGERFLILDNGHCVVIYGIDVAPRQTSAFKAFAEQNVVGKTVDIRLPKNHENIYMPGKEGRMWSGVAYGEPTDSRGRLYGEVHGLVFFNGHLLNIDYCRPQNRDTFLEYQRAYDRGEL